MAKKSGKFNLEKMSEEQLKAFIKKKKECDSKAQAIVIELLESTVSPSDFLKHLPNINQCHYVDVTVERAITKICGYPLCEKKLPDKLPKQTYKICTSTNTVYDITDRKKFCTNQCYTASCYIQNQLLTSPLWFRQEKEIPQFKLLPSNVKSVQGEVVDISLSEKNKEKPKDNFTSLLDFTEASLNDIEEKSSNKKSANEKITKISNKTTDKTSRNTNISSLEKKNEDMKELNLPKKKPENKMEKSNSNDKSNVKLLGDVVERKTPKEDSIITAGRQLQKKLLEKSGTSKTDKKKEIKEMSFASEYSLAVLHIEKCFSEWFCFDTLFFLFGEIKLKQLVSDKSEQFKNYLDHMMNKVSTDLHSYNQYEKLCKKLNLLELEDRKYDDNITNTKELKPLPNYAMLKEEGKMSNIKVASFFKGETEIPINKCQTSENEEEEEGSTNIPLLEKNSQHIIRRKIFLKGLDKVLPDMLKALCISAREISGDIRQLVATFNLQPDNIIFKSAQWDLIAIIIIKLLSIKNQRLFEQLNLSTSNKHLQLLMLSYKLDSGYLDRLVLWLTDLERILDVKP